MENDNGNGKSTVCWFFNNGGCKNKQCNFNHVVGRARKPLKLQQPCWDHHNPLTICKAKDKCNLDHDYELTKREWDFHCAQYEYPGKGYLSARTPDFDEDKEYQKLILKYKGTRLSLHSDHAMRQEPEVGCACASLIILGVEFWHHGDAKDRLGTNFDDFGSSIYTDENGETHIVYEHKHSGLIYSYSHAISDVPESWIEGATGIRGCVPGGRGNWGTRITQEKERISTFKVDNSLIPEIREYLLPTGYTIVKKPKEYFLKEKEHKQD